MTDPAARAAASEDEQEAFEIAELLLRAHDGRVRTIAYGPVLLGIEAVALPGHTAAHTGYPIRGDGAGLLLVGDMLQVTAVRPIDPDAGLVYDADPVLAADTRHRWLARAAQAGWSIAGGHLPGLFHISPAGPSDEGRYCLSPAGEDALCPPACESDFQGNPAKSLFLKYTCRSET